ncbi:hypothetical protein B9Z19DRAFT_989339 [Tuber borchii]|uniref:C2H2-type domain-containing protein n=1 Tax=Tuber borchii TaxID=42251 RepID=A0A2T6ZMP0_TUBBO|nr:hypothetical protein B9Z19DRAFT_989339 [Tuber borchii]
MPTQMGLGVSSAHEAMSHDACPNFPGEPYTINAETTVIGNDPQCLLSPSQVQKSRHVTLLFPSGSSETHTTSCHLMDLPFARQLIHNLSVSSRLHAASYSTTCPSKCARNWSPNEATSSHSQYHRVNEVCLGILNLFPAGITLCSDVTSKGCPSCKCAAGDSSLNREIGAQSSVAEGPSKRWGSAVGSTGGSGGTDRFASYMFFIWLLPFAVSTFLVAALRIPRGACAGALLNSTGEFVVSKSPRLRTPEWWLLPLLPSAFQSPYTFGKATLISPRYTNYLAALLSILFLPAPVGQLRLSISTTRAPPITKMSEYNNQQHSSSGEYPPLEYESHWEDALYGMVTGYEDQNLGYATDIPDLQPIYMEDLFIHQSPLDSQNSSPLTLGEEALWPPASEFGDNSPEAYFSFESSSLTSSPMNTPESFSTLSSGGQIPQSPYSSVDTPTTLSTLSPGGQIPQTPASLEPSSPPPPAPEPVQNPDGTWACPQPGCTHPGHKRRCDARKHYKSHTKPYACRVKGCEYRSSNAKDRERHYDTRHAKTRHPACPAPGCGVLKSRVDNMRDHIRRKHPEMDHKGPEISALYPRRGRN